MQGKGLILGKFAPLHVGHEYLIRFGLGCTPDLTVVVDNVAESNIPVQTRVTWIKEAFPTVKVVGLDKPTPQLPSDHPNFWEFWKETLLEAAGKVDYIYVSANYARRLAEAIDAELISCDIDRIALPISATEIKHDIMRSWKYLTKPAQRFYQNKVVFMGPESCGKTSAAKKLANRYCANYIPEYAAEFLKVNNKQIEVKDLELFLIAQQASFDAITYYPQQLAIADTDYLSTKVWAEFLFNTKLASPLNAHKLPTILFTPATPWEPAKHRLIEVSSNKERWDFYDLCIAYLEEEGREYFIIDAHEYDERTTQLDRILKKRFEL